MFRTDNPDADFDRWDFEQNKRLERLPRCSECDEAIQDDKAYCINGELICKNCMEANEVWVEDYCE